MDFSPKSFLQMMSDEGGSTTEYAFIEIGKEWLLNDLVRDGLVVRVPRKGDLDEIRITEKGRKFLN